VNLNETDIVNIIGAVCGTLIVIGTFVGWLLRHGSRLTGAEVRLHALAENAESDRRRHDAQWQQISAALLRIEDKLDRKADRT